MSALVAPTAASRRSTTIPSATFCKPTDRDHPSDRTGWCAGTRKPPMDQLSAQGSQPLGTAPTASLKHLVRPLSWNTPHAKRTLRLSVQTSSFHGWCSAAWRTSDGLADLACGVSATIWSRLESQSPIGAAPRPLHTEGGRVWECFACSTGLGVIAADRPRAGSLHSSAAKTKVGS